MPIGKGDPQSVLVTLIVAAQLAQRIGCAALGTTGFGQLSANLIPITSCTRLVRDIRIAKGHCIAGDRLACPVPALAQLDILHALGIELHTHTLCRRSGTTPRLALAGQSSMIVTDRL